MEQEQNDEPVEIVYDVLLNDGTGLEAILIGFDDEELWIPKSLISEHDEKQCSLELPEWFALKHGLI